MDDLSFEVLRAANVARCDAVFHKIDAWSETDWGCALAGEVGELCNLIKKRRRMVSTGLFDGTPRKENEDYAVYGAMAADEMADVVIYLDLLAARMGVDLGAAVRRKFNEVSDRRGSAVKLMDQGEVCDGQDDQE